MDVTEESSIEKAVRALRESHQISGLDVLINNAGIVVDGPLELLSREDLYRQFAVNVFGVHAVCRHFLPLLKQNKGKIVNIGSMSARMAIPFLGAYGASKAALKQISWALRLELKPWEVSVFHFELGNFPSSIWRKTSLDQNEQAYGAYWKFARNIKTLMESRAQAFNPVSLLLNKTLQTIEGKNKEFNTILGKDAFWRSILTSLVPYKTLEKKLLKLLNAA
jgi:NAD(P)-dependent dehydrogenase (short-subunit alcohol dehydrogenase family)